MSSPKVSIIIPVFNVEKVLKRCIDSLIAQTYQNIELIFVDDGSSDNSYNILEEAAASDRRIILKRQSNSGPSAARNLGIRSSTGDYIMFCDSDDTVEPDWCKFLIEAIINKPKSWIVCGINSLDEQGALIQKFTFNDSSNAVDVINISEYFNIYKKGLSGSPCNKIFNSHTMRTYNISFDESLVFGEDVKFVLSYLSVCETICVVNDTLYNYYKYQTADTLTNCYRSDKFMNQASLYLIRKPFINDKYAFEFKTIYWHIMINELTKTMETDAIQSLSSRITLNKNNIKSPEFKELLLQIGISELPKWQVKLLLSEYYALYYFLLQLASYKNKIKKAIFWRQHD